MYKLKQLTFLAITLLIGFGLQACQPGSLTPVVGSPFAVTQAPTALAFTNQPYQGNFLATADVNNIKTYSNVNGVLTLSATVSPGSTGLAYYPAASPAQNILISVIPAGTNQIQRFTSAPITGALNPLNQASVLVPNNVAYSLNGTYIAVTHGANVGIYDASSLASVASAASATTTHNGVFFHPSNNFVATFSNGSQQAEIFNFNSGAGTLTAVTGSPFTLVSLGNLASMAYSPDGLFLTAVGNNGSTFIYSVDQATGALTYTGLTFIVPGNLPTGQIQYAPNGRFAAIAGTAGNLVSMYLVDQTTGAFTLINSYATGGSPSALAFSFDSTVLAVANTAIGAYSISTYIVQPPGPDVTITPNLNPSCQGLSLQLQLTATATGIAPFTYSWTGPNGYTSTSNPALLPAPVQLSYAGNYQVTVTDANGCTGTANQTLTINPSPTSSIIPSGAQTACSGTNLSFTAQATGGTAPYTYEWFAPNSAIISTNQILTLNNIQTNQSGTYSLRVTDNLGCRPAGGALSAFSLTVNPSPTASVSPASQTACVGSTVVITSSVVSGVAPVTYAWSGPNGFTANTASITLTNLQLTDTGNYTLIVTDATGCASSSQSSTLTVNALPIAAATPASQTICGGTATFTASGGTSYAWTGPDGFTANTAVITVSNPGVYEVTVSVDGIGCSATAQVTLTNTGPVLTVSPNPASICIGSSATLTAYVTGGTTPYTYTWSDDSGVLSDEASITVTPTSVGTTNYSVSVSDANGCTSTQAVQVITNDIPTVTVTASATSITIGQQVVLTSIPTAVAPYELRWSDGLVQTGLAGVSTRTVSPLVSTQYSVIIVDATGCQSDPIVAVDITVDNSSAMSTLAQAILSKYCYYTGITA